MPKMAVKGTLILQIELDLLHRGALRFGHSHQIVECMQGHNQRINVNISGPMLLDCQSILFEPRQE